MQKTELYNYIQNKCRLYDEQFLNKSKFWDVHILPVIRTAQELAKEFSNVDDDVIEYSALLHDIACVEDYVNNCENHHEISAEIAAKIIGDNLPPEKVLAIQYCIRAHRGCVIDANKSDEATIIADADAIVHFQTIRYIFEWRIACGDQRLEAIDYTIKKIDKSFKKMSSKNQEKFIGLYKMSKRQLLQQGFAFQKGFVSSIIDNVQCSPIVECGCD